MDITRDNARLHIVYANSNQTEFVVRSGTSGHFFTVSKTWTGLVCTCPYGPVEPCSHKIAVEMYINSLPRMSAERQITIHIQGDKWGKSAGLREEDYVDA